ncbi:UTRA domain-containing protein [Vibrio sp. SS-MA-C1-2]|uniref:UTRA domain-containing protein n=1 Tax=Vibrio sp. SS-MA-C1-2 TaxID=2908646 RepID=UPI001F2466A9|nr:UTRA domain-containing protein [Vibrio sp. SS-MA-C1-2]UJF18470.1 UTRA domain-containing protein [Vibrio sp. SS-MA-C1-2]
MGRFYFFSNLQFDDLLKSKYALIEAYTGLHIARNRKVMSAVHPVEHIAKELNISKKTPIIKEEVIGYFDNDVAFEVGISFYRGNNYEFSFDALR